MKFKLYSIVFLLSVFCQTTLKAQEKKAQNPIIFSDVPDMSMIRVGDTYYMASTTMHMCPGVPVMKSKDLVNWEMLNYAYNTLGEMDELSLINGKNNYGKGSWASSLRYHNGTYYIATYAQTTDKTYIFRTNDIEKGQWKMNEFKPGFHDCTLVFDKGHAYLITGGGRLKLIELNEDLTDVKVGGVNQVLIENASAPTEPIMLPAEGSQLFVHDGKYYLFNISWPRGGMRTVLVHRADNLMGPWEGRIALQDKGVAQGGIIDTPDGRWFAYLFQDHGSVGRIPYLVPMKWVDGWPVIGVDGKVPDKLDLPASKGLIPGIVNNDEFTRKMGEPELPLVWQWNHNPDNKLWSVTQRKGYLRLTTGRIDSMYLMARNTLTQRTIGPVCSGITSVDVSNMKDGDFAGLSVLQRKFALVGVKINNGIKSIVMVSAESGNPVEIQSIPFDKSVVYFKIECDFKDKVDLAYCFYSLDGKSWTAVGSKLKMEYSIPHFMGNRFGLFNYATKNVGGFADFDFFHIEDKITKGH